MILLNTEDLFLGCFVTKIAEAFLKWWEERDASLAVECWWPMGKAMSNYQIICFQTPTTNHLSSRHSDFVCPPLNIRNFIAVFYVFIRFSPDMPRNPLLETGGKWRSRCVKPSWNKRRRLEWEETPYSHLLEWQRRARFLGFLDMFKTSYLNLFKFSSKMTPWAGWSSKLTNSIQLLCFHPPQIVTHRAWFQFWRPALAWPTTISLRLEGHPRFWRKTGFM